MPGFKKIVAAEMIFYLKLDTAPTELAKTGYELLKDIRYSDKKIMVLFNLMRYSANEANKENTEYYASLIRDTLITCHNEFEAEVMATELQQIIFTSEGERFRNKRKALNYLKISKITQNTEGS